jgi:gluconolactonase
LVFSKRLYGWLSLLAVCNCCGFAANHLVSNRHAGVAAAAGDTAITLKVERLDPALDAIVPAGAEALRIASGLKWTEGPLWLPTGHLLFAEIPSNSIREYTPGASGDAISIFMQPSGYKGSAPYGGAEPGSNAMTLDAKGRLTVAGHAQRDVWRLESPASHLDPNAQVTLLADTYQGKRLNSPNDLVYKSDGSLYFTDPPYGLREQSDKDPEKEIPFSGVYRIPGATRQKPGTQPQRASLQLLIKNLPRPNGIAFSPDEKYLYIDNSEPQMYWMRYTVKPDGSLTDGKRFGDAGIYAHKGAPDGMKVDERGNLYSAGPGGIWIFSADGKHLGTIDIGVVGNLAWGGPDYKTLFVMAGPAIYSIRLQVPGVHLRAR